MSTRTETSADGRIEQIAEDLRGALWPLVREIAGPSPRAATLCRKLGVDKSLGANLVRALRCDEYYDFLHHVPAPNGLRIFLAAAKEAGASLPLIRAAEEGTDGFQGLIAGTPGGWKTLSAVISSFSQEAKDRNEKRAKQAIYTSMSYLLGVQCESIVTAFILHPSADGESVDCVDLSIRDGVRRLRPTYPLALFEYNIDARGEGGDESPAIRTLDGSAAAGPTDFVLRDYSDDPLPELEIIESESGERRKIVIALSEDGPSLQAPFTIAQGMSVGGVFHRYRTHDHNDECRTYMLDVPCKRLSRDIFVHKSLYPSGEPQVTMYMPRISGPIRERYPGIRGLLNQLDMAVPVSLLGPDLAKAGLAHFPPYASLLPRAFEQAGWDPAEFRGYRIQVTYPVPNIYMSIWFSLPDRP
jgi:hypothetical protein